MLESPSSIAELLVRYELFNLVRDKPGSIAQVGVGGGTGLLMWAVISDLLDPYGTDRLCLGFDAFEFYPVSDSDEVDTLQEFKKSDFNRFSDVSLSNVERAIAEYKKTIPFPNRQKDRVQLVVGNVEQTLPTFSAQGLRFALLDIDVNMRGETRAAIDNLWPLLLPGGVCAFGGFAAGPWEGESEVVAAFLAENPGLEVKRMLGFPYPSAYVIKP